MCECIFIGKIKRLAITYTDSTVKNFYFGMENYSETRMTYIVLDYFSTRTIYVKTFCQTLSSF